CPDRDPVDAVIELMTKAATHRPELAGFQATEELLRVIRGVFSGAYANAAEKLATLPVWRPLFTVREREPAWLLNPTMEMKIKVTGRVRGEGPRMIELLKIGPEAEELVSLFARASEREAPAIDL